MINWISKQLSKTIPPYLWLAVLLLSGVLAGCARQPAGLLRPNGIAIAPDGTLYIMDRGNYRVVHASAQGEFLDTFGQLGPDPGDIYGGWDLELDSGGNIYLCNLVWTEEGYYRERDGVEVFSPEGDFVQEIGSQEYEPVEDQEPQTPYGLDIDAQDRVYVAGFDSNTVRIFKPTGELLATLFGEAGTDDGQFNGLLDVAVDDRRHLLYITDQFNSRVQQFELAETTPGQFTATHRLSFGSYGREAGQFAYPQNVTVDEQSGQVYVSDMANRRVQIFDAEGRYLSELAAPIDWQVLGLDLAPDGTIYVVDALNSLIWVFEPDGQLRQRLEVGT